MTRFGDFAPLCTNTPSYTWCNLFYRQLSSDSSLKSILTGLSADANSAPVGINPVCGIAKAGTTIDGPHQGTGKSLGNIANIVVCAVSMLVILGLIVASQKRKAAVGRVELRNLLILYFLTLPFQLLTTGSFLAQGSTALVALTAIHAGLVAAFFWALLMNALIATQKIEDGTPAALVPYLLFCAAFFAGTTYIAFDVGLGITTALGPSNDPRELRSIPLFVLTSIWPAVAAILYFGIMTYIVLAVLNETRPMWYYILSAGLFVLSQLAWFLLGKVICEVSNILLDFSILPLPAHTTHSTPGYLTAVTARSSLETGK
ncbi:chitin synthase III catalytic subunit-domain-containing protein [Lentinula edodes]|uniref:chitin synthase III catalytic subunit-domain-containing protein n=1 Tax=Lentinula edodes TaxID=5353 RepID=UPI001E8DB403|nr:chitin synthase III catalytic subunit-domain-containing protein [Lentinula edodes]KAH7870170.1 chitin synthase III catalytic subunit-domain-containing protein [Lentinula edodes]KAJ3902493.1 chitin synthase III catalytic subunit-domain-containing protein [Lentinula edodes]